MYRPGRFEWVGGVGGTSRPQVVARISVRPESVIPWVRERLRVPKPLPSGLGKVRDEDGRIKVFGVRTLFLVPHGDVGFEYGRKRSSLETASTCANPRPGTCGAPDSNLVSPRPRW